MKDTESPAYKWARRQEKIPTELEQLREQVAALTTERDDLRDKLITIQVEIGDLIPAIDGERANDRITGRVVRVVNQLAATQVTNERLREALITLRSCTATEEQYGPDETYDDSWEKVSELFTVDQLREAKVEVLIDAAFGCRLESDADMIRRMIAEIEKGE